MRGSCTVALVGFSQQDAVTLESFLRAAGRYMPGFQVQDEVMDAQILIVNADSPNALHLVRHAELPGRVLLIGNADGGTGWPLHRRPINRAAMRAELDRMLNPQSASAQWADQPHAPGRRQSLAPVVPPGVSREAGFSVPEYFPGAPFTPPLPAAGSGRRSRDSEFQRTEPMRRAAITFDPQPGVIRMTDLGAIDELPLSLARARPSRRSGDKPLPVGQRLPPDAPETSYGDVLLVADSLVDGRILSRRLKKYDFSVDWLLDPVQALERIKKHRYRLVVIDRLSGESDASQVCRAVKQDKQKGQAPVVVMFAAMAGSMDRMKASLAGCDAYLSRSVGEADFYKLLALHRLVGLNAFARTNIGV